MQLRRNHGNNVRSNATILPRVFFILLIMGAVLYFLILKREEVLQYFKSPGTIENPEDTVIRTYIPTHQGQLLHKKHFSVSFDQDKKNAEWVAYFLSKEDLRNRDWNGRLPFSTDNEIASGKTDYYDYSGSGFERGHLVPAADMSFDSIALAETFLLSNIVPQHKACNRGIWKELEKQTRRWIQRLGSAYVMAGPVYQGGSSFRKIHKSQIAIPSHFFKVILVYENGVKDAIAFIIPNGLSERPLEEYIVTIDQVEKLTGIDFFQYMLEDDEEEKLESDLSIEAFSFDEYLFRQRIESWNFE